MMVLVNLQGLLIATMMNALPLATALAVAPTKDEIVANVVKALATQTK